MSKTLAANEILLRAIELEDLQTTQPDIAGFAAAIGSMGVEHGVYPTTPTNLWLKSLADDHGWLKQNLTGVRTFNVKDPIYGAVGDGITDDRVAIQAAIDACQAAGGGIVYFPPTAASYLVTKGPFNVPFNEYASITLINYHNITLMGDGAASKIAFVDDAGGLSWQGIETSDGTTNVSFVDLSLDGSGMANPAAASALISLVSRITDTHTGSGNFLVSNCVLGPTTRRCLNSFAASDVLRINNIEISQCVVNGSLSTASAIQLLQFFNHALVRHNFGTMTGSPATTGAAILLSNNAQVLPDDIWDWRVNGNHAVRTENPGAAAGLITSGGASLSHNTITSATANLGISVNLRHHDVRGNVVVLTDTFSQSIINAANQSASTGTGSLQESSARGNVAVRTVYTTGSASGISAAIAATAANALCQMSDNIAETGTTGTTRPVSLSVAGGAVNINAVLSGNISITHAAALGGGGGVDVFTSGVADTPAAASVVGNLTVVAEGNAIGAAARCFSTAGHNNQLTDIRFNFGAGTQRAVDVSAGTKLNWIQVLMNQVTPANTTQEVSPPAANAGYTAGANAGASPSIMVGNAALAGNVQAKKGSLGSSLTGAQGTTIAYKETDDGTPIGGANGWFGVAGYEVSFGVTGGSTTATALFYGGGMGLATPIATEIQFAMPRPGLLRTLRIRCTAGTGGGTVTHNVRKNGVNVITIAMVNTATNVSEAVTSVVVAKGDLISMQVTKTGTITTGQTLTRSVMELAS